MRIDRRRADKVGRRGRPRQDRFRALLRDGEVRPPRDESRVECFVGCFFGGPPASCKRVSVLLSREFALSRRTGGRGSARFVPDLLPGRSIVRALRRRGSSQPGELVLVSRASHEVGGGEAGRRRLRVASSRVLFGMIRCASSVIARVLFNPPFLVKSAVW
jgi:hypothetical protein